jgi:sugar/nucleoside kinase (ribokinase family)
VRTFLAKAFSIGNICLDCILRYARDMPKWGREIFFDEGEQRLAGQCANFAIALAKLGCPTWVVGSLGNDETGNRFAREMSSIPLLNCTFLRQEGGITGFTISVIRTDGERSFLTFLGHQTNYSLGHDEGRIIENVQKGDFVHVSGYFMLPSLQEELPRFLKIVKSKGAIVSFDPGWDPTDFGESARKRTFACLTEVDLFLPNVAELMALTSTESPDSAIQRLARSYGGVTVVKAGEKGCRIAKKGESLATVASYPVKVVDTTGAGDVFDAGFIYAMTCGHSLEVCGKFANAAAALSISRPGSPDTRFPNSNETSGLLNAK